jgi:hypothetical protein
MSAPPFKPLYIDATVDGGGYPPIPIDTVSYKGVVLLRRTLT